MKKLGFDLIILGDSASGKDTQALALQKQYRLKPVASGVYFRKLMQQPKYKKILEQTYAQGRPAPTKLMLGLLNESFRQIKSNQNFIFIGAARLKPEAEFLKKYLDKHGRDFLVLYIKLPKSEVIRRSLKRGRAGDLDKRFLENRFAYYRVQVSQTVDYYKKLGKLKFINGNQNINRVSKDIAKAIHDYQRPSTTRNS